MSVPESINTQTWLNTSGEVEVRSQQVQSDSSWNFDLFSWFPTRLGLRFQSILHLGLCILFVILFCDLKYWVTYPAFVKVTNLIAFQSLGQANVSHLYPWQSLLALTSHFDTIWVAHVWPFACYHSQSCSHPEGRHGKEKRYKYDETKRNNEEAMWIIKRWCPYKKHLAIYWMTAAPNGGLIKKGKCRTKLKWSHLCQGQNRENQCRLIKEN